MTFQVGDVVKVIKHSLPEYGKAGVVDKIVYEEVWPVIVKFDDGEEGCFTSDELQLMVKTAVLTDDDVFGVTLNEEDPFERVLVDIVKTNRKKRADYAVDGSPWSNFEFTAGVLNMPPVDAAVHNVAQKLARLTSLRANGRMADTANEAVTDTYLDMAVYATIAYAIHLFPSGKVG